MTKHKKCEIPKYGMPVSHFRYMKTDDIFTLIGIDSNPNSFL